MSTASITNSGTVTPKPKILLTGGAGYIGTHTALVLLQTGQFEVHVLDNLCNSSLEGLRRVEQQILKLSHHALLAHVHQIDLCDEVQVNSLFATHSFDAVIHFAGLKAVGESVQQPLRYYHNNITGTLILLQAMAKYHCKKIIFSSSATVYGDPHTVPIMEHFPIQPTNPYGRTKAQIESILQDLAISDPSWRVVILRYFNPVGAHPSGLIGEDPKQPNNLMPYISQVAVGRKPMLNVFGNDYPTVDGTGVRDYIHVMDLAKGHLAALVHGSLSTNDWSGSKIYNLGRGQGYSVLQMVKAFEEVSGKSIPYQIQARRTGDIATCYADPSLAEKELHWKTELELIDMCRDAWNWQSSNPHGYTSSEAKSQ